MYGNDGTWREQAKNVLWPRIAHAVVHFLLLGFQYLPMIEDKAGMGLEIIAVLGFAI